MENTTERNLEIFELKEKGFTFDKIAKKYGITRERVRKIYLREKRRKEIVNELPYLRINLQDGNDKRFYYSLLRYTNRYYGFQHVLSKEEFLNINPDDFMLVRQVGAVKVDRLVELQNELKKENMSWGFNLEEEKKEYPVSGTVTISCEEYRDLIGRIYELKAKAQKEHDDWYEEYQKAIEKANELKEYKEQSNELLRKIKFYQEFVNSDDEVNAKYKDFVAKKKLEELKEEEEE